MYKIEIADLVVRSHWNYNKQQYEEDPDKAEQLAHYKELSGKLAKRVDEVVKGRFKTRISPSYHRSYYRRKRKKGDPYIDITIEMPSIKWLQRDDSLFVFIAEIYAGISCDCVPDDFKYWGGTLTIPVAEKVDGRRR